MGSNASDDGASRPGGARSRAPHLGAAASGGAAAETLPGAPESATNSAPCVGS